MRHARLAVLALPALLAVASPGLAKKDPGLPADHPFLALLTGATIERGREDRALIVHPIAAAQPDPAQADRARTSREASEGEHLSAGEPDKNPGRGPVDLFNWSTRPILLLAGEVFEGGIRDRFLARDVLLRPGSRVLAPAYLADRRRRAKSEVKKELEPLDALAPDLLRLVGVTGAAPAAVDSFLEDAYALAGEKHDRSPLAHLLGAPKLEARMAEYRAVFGAIPDEAKKRTIGVAALVGDRLVGVDLFSSNAELRAHWPKILRTLAYQATLYEVSYGLLALPFPNAGKDPDRHRTEIKGFLEKAFAARAVEVQAVDLGGELRLARDELVGRVLLDDGAVVHAVLQVDYLRTGVDAPPPPGNPPPEVTPEELERRAERGRLTEYERRLLERMRRRRQNPGPVRPPNRGSGGTRGTGGSRGTGGTGGSGDCD